MHDTKVALDPVLIVNLVQIDFVDFFESRSETPRGRKQPCFRFPCPASSEAALTDPQGFLSDSAPDKVCDMDRSVIAAARGRGRWKETVLSREFSIAEFAQFLPREPRSRQSRPPAIRPHYARGSPRKPCRKTPETGRIPEEGKLLRGGVKHEPARLYGGRPARKNYRKIALLHARHGGAPALLRRRRREFAGFWTHRHPPESRR